MRRLLPEPLARCEADPSTGYVLGVRRLLPEPVADVDPMELYPALARPRPAGRPWLMVNMIASADGAIEVDGTSEALGDPADEAVFSAVRACADWIVAAAGTARAERYGLPRPAAAARRARRGSGRAARPRLAVVSARLDLGLDLPMFADRRADEDPPLVVTGLTAPRRGLERLEPVAEVVQVQSSQPSPEDILAILGDRGAEVVLSEGGASLNAQFADAALIDELCLSIAPMIAGGDSPRLVAGSTRSVPVPMRLAHLLEDGGTLFARYLAPTGLA